MAFFDYYIDPLYVKLVLMVTTIELGIISRYSTNAISSLNHFEMHRQLPEYGPELQVLQVYC